MGPKHVWMTADVNPFHLVLGKDPEDPEVKLLNRNLQGFIRLFVRDNLDVSPRQKLMEGMAQLVHLTHNPATAPGDNTLCTSCTLRRSCSASFLC